MAAELGLLSLTRFQKKSQFRQIQSEPLMWNPNQIPQLDEDDDSWEVRAFEQDSSNVTWPPRSYTCTFCRREFRSAQALGGHMNVHRRDRARLHQAPPPLLQGTKIPASAATFLIPSQEIVTTNGGLCFVYSLPNPNGVSTPILGGLNTNFAKSPSSNFASISTINTNSLFQSCPAPSYNTSNSPSWKLLPVTSESKNPESNNFYYNESKKNSAVEELDLELRLGRR